MLRQSGAVLLRCSLPTGAHAYPPALRPQLLSDALTAAARHPGPRMALSTSAFAAKLGMSSVGIKFALLFSAAVGAAALGKKEDVSLAYLIPLRLARDVWTAGSMVADYKVSLRGKEGEEREAALHECHRRGAQRLLNLCFLNGGIYTKLGQHIGQLDHLMPEEYVKTMRENLLDRCPASSIQQVREIIQQDLGAPPEQLFASFDDTPIASASLAQVHVATAHDGRKLAIKVQHAGLRETCAADVATIDALVKTARVFFPDFDMQWLIDEVKQNLPLELDFLHEAANAAECRVNLLSSRSRLAHRVHVPEVYPELTSHRVLAMEYIGDAVGVSDVPAVRRLGFKPGCLARLISETFNEMIFTHGHVHCDPHAANMLVRKDKEGRMQLVLLDHGLYKRLDDAFRLEYAGLWRSLILADERGIRRHSEQMNAGGDAVVLFTMMLTQRPWKQIVHANARHLRVPHSDEHRSAVRDTAAKHAKEISQMLLNMPRPLLLLLKTNDCLRSVDFALGQPVNTFVITARECTKALAEHRLDQAAGLRSIAAPALLAPSLSSPPSSSSPAAIALASIESIPASVASTRRDDSLPQLPASASSSSSSSSSSSPRSAILHEPRGTSRGPERDWGLLTQLRLLPTRLQNAVEALGIEARISVLHLMAWRHGGGSAA